MSTYRGSRWFADDVAYWLVAQGTVRLYEKVKVMRQLASGTVVTLGLKSGTVRKVHPSTLCVALPYGAREITS